MQAEKDLLRNIGLTSKLMFAVVFILIVAGCLIDAVPALLIFAPILIPTATQYGISLIHFGVVVVVPCVLTATPVGINLFVALLVGD